MDFKDALAIKGLLANLGNPKYNIDKIIELYKESDKKRFIELRDIFIEYWNEQQTDELDKLQK